MTEHPPTHTDSGTVRIEAFSDSVIAIAITLLVLQIKMPNSTMVGQKGLIYTLLMLWPSYLAFVTSFITILVMWVKHHWMFSFITKTDHAFLYWNGLLLFLIVFLPFPTALLAEYLLDANANVAASLYTGTIFAISLVFNGLWRHAAKGNKLISPYSSRMMLAEIKQIDLQNLFGPPLYLVAFALSFFYHMLSVILCLSLPLFFTFRDFRSNPPGNRT